MQIGRPHLALPFANPVKRPWHFLGTCCLFTSVNWMDMLLKTAVFQDAVIMFIGCLMLAVANGTTANGWVIMYAISQLVFGFGVGGMRLPTSFCPGHPSLKILLGAWLH